MELYVIRHGQTSWNVERRLQGQTDTLLDEEGIRLARLTGYAMRFIHFDRCISSPLKRALDTAGYVIGSRKIPLETDSRLKEISFGVWEGLSARNRQFPSPGAGFADFFGDPAHYEAPENGEDFYQLSERMKDFLNSLDGKRNETVLVSTHGTAMRALLGIVGCHEIKDFWYRKVPENCAVAHLISENGAWVQDGEERTWYENL